jgi:hypothetical protein
MKHEIRPYASADTIANVKEAKDTSPCFFIWMILELCLIDGRIVVYDRGPRDSPWKEGAYEA